MVATGLPVPTPAPANAVSTATTPAGAAEAPAGDFLSMFAQLLGASGAAIAAASSTPAQTTSEEPAVSDEAAVEQGEVLPIAAMLSLANPIVPAPLGDAGTGAAGAIGDVVASAGRALDADTLLETMAGAAKQAGLAEVTSSASQSSVPATPVTGVAAPQVATFAPPTAVAAAPPEAHHVQTPVGSPQWSDDVGTQVVLMAEQGKQTASLRLSPEHLGPLEVHISMDDDKASVWFGATHSDTRAALEQALPRLREMLASQGLSLTDAGVFREPPRDQPQAQPASLSRGSADADTASAVTVTVVKVGLVDAYA